MNLIIKLLEYVVIPLGQISLLLFVVMSIILIIKYKTFAFFWNAKKKEMIFVKVGLLGFLIFGAAGILLSILS